VTTITATEFRKQPGYYFFRVAKDRQTFLISHQGKIVAKLGPTDDDTTVIERDGTMRGELPRSALLPRAGGDG
jgi:hypothetical protein